MSGLIPLQEGLWVRALPKQLRLSDYRLIAFDMDSTLINIECVDEIADLVGRKAEVAAITEAAMRGEIEDYKESLRRRVALLAGAATVAVETVMSRAELARSRRQLAQLDERLLRDIGLDRMSARQEASKGYWL